MIELNLILSLLGMNDPKIQIISYDEAENGIMGILSIELSYDDEICPYCKSKKIYVKEKYIRTIRYNALIKKQITIYATVRRLKCLECSKTFTQNLSFVEKGRSISNLTYSNILDDLKTLKTVSQIASENHVSTFTVSSILDKSIPYQKAKLLPEILCIDEFCFKHSGSNLEGKYPCVLTDGESGEIVDIIVSRRKEYLNDYFSKIPDSQRKNVKFLVSDMFDGYESIRSKFFPSAIHIVDIFHVTKAFNEIITKIRTRILKQNDKDSSEYRFLKKNWKIFLKNRKDAEKIFKTGKYGVVYRPIDTLDEVLKKYDDLNNAYWDRQDFSSKCKLSKTYTESSVFLNFYIEKYSKSLIQEQKDLGNTLKKWKVNIANAISKNYKNVHLSNAKAEANNNKIQTLIDISCGCPSFERLRKRILYIERNKK